MSELDRQITEAQQKVAILADLQQAGQDLPRLEAERLRQAREAQVSAQLDQARQVARDAVEKARPEIASWREDFVSWLTVGQQLLRRLQAIEGPLWDALKNAVAYAGRYSGNSRDESNQLTDKHLAMDNALVEVGGVDPDLWPLPPDTSDAFALEATGALVQFAGNVYAPWLRVNQFLRHGFNR